MSCCAVDNVDGQAPGGGGGGGGSETWAQVLANGAPSGGTSPIMTFGDAIVGEDRIGQGGPVTLIGGNSLGAGGDAGGFNFVGGVPDINGTGSIVFWLLSDGDGTGPGGFWQTTTGNGGAGGGAGGSITESLGDALFGNFAGGGRTFSAGNASGTGQGGRWVITLGNSPSGQGGAATYTTGTGATGGFFAIFCGPSTNGPGADIVLEAGDAGGGNFDGGDINAFGGNLSGAGLDGQFFIGNFRNIFTASPLFVAAGIEIDFAPGLVNADIPFYFEASATVPGGAPAAGLGVYWVDLDNDARFDTSVGGSVLNPNDFSAYNANNSAGFTPGNTITMPLDTQDFVADATLYSLAGNEVTVLRAGRYEISYDLGQRTPGGNLTAFQAVLQVNAVDVPGSLCGIGSINSTDGSSGRRKIIDLATNDVVRVRVTNFTGTGTITLQAQYCGLTIIRR